MTQEVLTLALEALTRSRKAVSDDLDLAGCAYGKNDPDGHRYESAKTALVTLDKAVAAIKETLTKQEQWVFLTRDDHLEVLAKLDPQTKRLPPGFAMFAEAIEEKSREKNFKGAA